MPRYLKQDGTPHDDVVFTKVWFLIPEPAPQLESSFLVEPRVADYIEMLENKITELTTPAPTH